MRSPELDGTVSLCDKKGCWTCLRTGGQNFQIPGIMVNFMGQLDWATGCPDIWPDILGMSVRVFLNGLTFESVDRVKQILLPAVGGLHPVSCVPK